MYISGGLVISGDDSLSFCADGQSCKESQEHMPSLHTVRKNAFMLTSHLEITPTVCAYVYSAVSVGERKRGKNKCW